MTKKTIAQLVADGRKFTIDGKPATILTTTRPCRYYPVAAETAGGFLHTFTAYGAYNVYEDSHLDLTPVPLPKYGYIAVSDGRHCLVVNTVFKNIVDLQNTLAGVSSEFYTVVPVKVEE